MPPALLAKQGAAAGPTVSFSPDDAFGAMDGNSGAQAAAVAGPSSNGPVDEPSPLHAAAQRGDLQVLGDLLDTGSARATDRDPQNITALHWAAINGHLLACSLLLGRGAEVDAFGGELVATPLMWAARNGRVYIVHLLLSRGADPALKDSQGFNTLHLATHSSSALTVAYLLACARLSIDVDARDPEGHTALHWACYQGDALSVDLLLSHGASVSAADNNAMTPLHWAVVKGNSTCIRKLIDAGANADAKTSEAKTPRDMAEELKATAAWNRALGEGGCDPDGRPRRQFLSPQRTRLAVFAVALIGLGTVFATFAMLPWYSAWLLAVAESYAMHHVICITLLDAKVRGGGRLGDVLTKSPYFAAIISSSLVWVLYVWLFRIFPGKSSLLPSRCRR